MKVEVLPKATKWMTEKGNMVAYVAWNSGMGRWLFIVPHPTKQDWRLIQHRHVAREDAEAEAKAYVVTKILEAS